MADIDHAARETDPEIEAILLELADGDLRRAALDFVSYLREKNMAPRLWFHQNYWRVPHDGHYLCALLVDRERWRVFFFLGDYGGEFEEGWVRTVQDNVRPCVSCTGGDCPKGRETTVFGRKFANTCYQFPVQFVNPDERAVACIKELIEYWKGVAARSESWHAR